MVGKGTEGQIRIGIMLDDGHIRPHPPIKRGLLALKAVLEQDVMYKVVVYSELVPALSDLKAADFWYARS